MPYLLGGLASGGGGSGGGGGEVGEGDTDAVGNWHQVSWVRSGDEGTWEGSSDGTNIL